MATTATPTRRARPARVVSLAQPCGCLDLPRAHSRGEIGCEHEPPRAAPARPTANQIENARLRRAQADAFLAATGTDDLR